MIKRKVMETEKPQKNQRYKGWKKKDIKGREAEDTTERSILPSQKLPGDNLDPRCLHLE